ncbi:hypothetical protein [Aureimonas mangrovi]|uniref:hypothetical protein n=1 Tax=Aureimonas mangrovi TaxID=2758041 RepID=UPI00163D9F19|nr:hypothetical protein [Aureimonas mangrovi]
METIERNAVASAEVAVLQAEARLARQIHFLAQMAEDACYVERDALERSIIDRRQTLTFFEMKLQAERERCRTLMA